MKKINKNNFFIYTGALTGIFFVLYAITTRALVSSPWVQTTWDGGVGASTTTQYSTATNIRTITADQLTLTTYNLGDTGMLTSAIFDTEGSPNWGNLTYTAQLGSGVQVRVRTSNLANMSDATYFEGCDTIENGGDISESYCVTDGDRYVQYAVLLSSVLYEEAEVYISPVFENISLAFSSGNSAPTISTLGATASNDGSGNVAISVITNDADSDVVKLKAEYKSGSCDVYSGQTTTTLSNTVTATYNQSDITINNSAADGFRAGGITTASGANTIVINWASKTDTASANGAYCIFLTANDGTTDSSRLTASITLDNVSPTAPGSLSVSSTLPTGITFTLGTASNDSNFIEYKIYYKTGSSGVTVLDSVFTSSSDSNLGLVDFNEAETVNLTGLNPNTQYVANIFTFDTFGNTVSSSAETSVYTQANIPTSLSTSANSESSVTVSWNANSNPAGTEYYVEDISESGRNSSWINNTSYIFSNLSSGTSYSFKVKARNSSSIETDYITGSGVQTNTNGGGGFVASPPTFPPNTEGNRSSAVVINNHATSTDSQLVTVRVSATNATQMAVSNRPDFPNAVFIPYSETFNWTLPEGSGTKTVYVLFRASNGAVTNTTPPPNDEIFLNSGNSSDEVIATPNENPNCPLRTGSVYRVPGRFKRYYVTPECTLQSISNARLFYSYFDSWTETQPADRNVISNMPKSREVPFLGPKASLRDGEFVRREGELEVYQFINSRLQRTDSIATTTYRLLDISRNLFDRYEPQISL